MSLVLCRNSLTCNFSCAFVRAKMEAHRAQTMRRWNEIGSVMSHLRSLCGVTPVDIERMSSQRSSSSRHATMSGVRCGPAACWNLLHVWKGYEWMATFVRIAPQAWASSLQVKKSNNAAFDFQPDCLETQSSGLMPSARANSQQTLRNGRHFSRAWSLCVPVVEAVEVDDKVARKLCPSNFEL